MDSADFPQLDSGPSDEDILDAAFERALEHIEDGRPIEAEDLLQGRIHLRESLRKLVELAHEVAVGRMEPRPQLGGYQLLNEIGRGGMGTVFLARQERVGGRLVAVKILPAAAALSARSRERFLTECHILAQLRHPHVVSILDVIHEVGVYAYAMEWIDGPSLAGMIEYLKQREGRPVMADVRRFLDASETWALEGTYVNFVCRIGIAVARALSAVHADGVIHRDVKPSNILLRRDGTPLLSDFGVVRETDTTVYTQTGHFVGTPAYAAPEQLRGDVDAIDARSDIYGLGATLYHALTLRLPFASSPSPFKGECRGQVYRSPVELLARIESGPVTPLRKLNPKLPVDLQTIVAKAMEPDPPRRYASADDVADDLERFSKLQPIKAKPAGLVMRATKLARRNKRSFIAGVVGATVAAIFAVFAGMCLFWLPGWIDRNIGDARLELLNPAHGELIYFALNAGEPRSQRESPTPMSARVTTATLDSALEHYDRVLWVSRYRADRHILQLERDTVELASALTHAWQRTTPPHKGNVEELCAKIVHLIPTTSKLAKAWKDDKQNTSVLIDIPPGASPLDLRCAGLLAYLCRDARMSHKAWERLQPDPRQEGDALVDAALGELYLTSGDAPRAFPRLDRAFRAFPRAGFLAIALADAAVRCGELAYAEQCLLVGLSLPLRDPFETNIRVLADLYAARRDESRADTECARELYDHMLKYHQVPTAYDHFLRFLEHEGDFDAMIRVCRTILKRGKYLDKYRSRLVEAANAWSATWTQEQWVWLFAGEEPFGDLYDAYNEALWFLEAPPSREK